ncbi:MAG: CinA family nicotinamide mononucleotide deamidase-related protein [Phycisphaera sp.]|nr:MAG: CinA family nicotinamide mononucleotide deamidase-related protein [Phycisphaera sp.]
MTDPSERPLAALLSIGDELVLGEKLDTNSKWLADRLGAAGVLVAEHRTVPDHLETIANAIVHLVGVADVVIVGGGLGPTADDLTRQALGRALELLSGKPQPLVEDPRAVEAIRGRFERSGRTMPEANLVQALRPASAEGLPNEHGTAPGMLARVHVLGRPRLIACLPGPPREMRPMFERALAPEFRRLPGVAHAELRVAQVFGLGESELATRIADLMHRDNNPAVGTTASSGMVTCRVRAEPSRPVRGPYRATEPLLAVEEALATIERLAAGYVVSRENRTLGSTLLDEAATHGISIATAESCTGGLVGQILTAEPGSSRAYAGGWITYSNEMKLRELGVPQADLDTCGAVSAEVARAMAVGAADRAGVDLALSITGIAGPDGGTSEKPVGTVWVGCAHRGQPARAKGFRFAGNRDAIRLWSANTALFIGLQAIRGQTEHRLLWEDA